MKKQSKEKGLFILILIMMGIFSYMVPITAYWSMTLSMALLCLYIVSAGIFQFSIKLFQKSKSESKRSFAYWIQVILVAIFITAIAMTLFHSYGIAYDDYKPTFPYPKTTMAFMIGTFLFTLPGTIKVFSN